MTDQSAAELDQRAFVGALEAYENGQMRGDTIAKCIASAIGAYNLWIGQSAADRIAAAPRAWAVKTSDGRLQVCENKDTAAIVEFYNRGVRAIPIAIVPLTEKEASQ